MTHPSCCILISIPRGALCLVIAVLLGFTPLPARCDETPPCSAQLHFAESLNREGDYFRAITEYKRVMYHCEQDSLRSAADVGIGRALFLAGRYASVVDWRAAARATRDSSAADLLGGHSLYRLANYEEALPVLRQAESTAAGALEAGQAAYLAGLSLTRLERWDEARLVFSRVAAESPYRSKSQSYHELLREVPTYSRRSPELAGWLGVVPGLGYAYTGHTATAFASLVVNGLLWWATIDAFESGHTAAGATYSIFAVGFYAGNIVGSVQSAHRYNEWQYERFHAQFTE